MSCYNSEHGHLTFTKTGYKTFIQAVRKAMNEYYAHAFTVAERMHAELSTITGRGAADLRRETFRRWEEQDGLLRLPRGNVQLDDYIVDLIGRELFRGKDGALTQPRKSAFPKFINTQTAFTVKVDNAATMTFQMAPDGHGSVHWSIYEGNRNVEGARQTKSYAALIGALKAYVWKRGEGGCFYYMDEYIRHDANEDGRSVTSEISAAWGPVGAAEKDARWNARVAVARAMTGR